jgi:signal transduction histidine kinase
MSLQLQRSSSQIAQNERSRMINLMASGLAHELRNHLTGARLAIQTCSPDPSTQEALSISLKQMKLAEETIQRLLTLKVDATEKLSAPMTLQQICEAVREMVLPIASHQRVLFQMEDCCGSDGQKVSRDCLETWVDDGSSIVGAIVNLVLNALEAAGPGGAVEVSAKRLDDACKTMEWVVQDNGPGPTQEIVATMFEPFATTKREGVGLGLAMCRRIAQRHHGDVNWHRENGRTTFTLRIRTDRIV